jgi:hypothetical protein
MPARAQAQHPKPHPPPAGSTTGSGERRWQRYPRPHKKPTVVAEMIERFYPTVPKAEMFARGPPRPGWDAHGNEVDEAAE